MPYTHYDAVKPDATTQNLTEMGQSMRDNARAVRDAIAIGLMPGWDLTPSGGTAEQPAMLTYDKGLERIRLALTWGTTGGEAGSVTVIVAEYSGNSGTDWVSVGTQTITYDTAGNVTGMAWS